MADKKEAEATASNQAENTAPALLTLHQWCTVSGQVPHRIRAFAKSQPSNEHDKKATAEEWAAKYKAFGEAAI